MENFPHCNLDGTPPRCCFLSETGEALKSASKMVIFTTDVSLLLMSIGNAVLYGNDVHDGRASKWVSSSFDQLWRQKYKEEIAVRECFKLFLYYQRDFRSHVFASEHLLTCLKVVFRQIKWCSTLYQRTDLHENASSFAQKLISAATNGNLWHKSPAHHHSHPATDSNTSSSACTVMSQIIAFFSKTAPLPCHRNQ